MIDCHMIVDVNKALRPKRRKRTVGEALMKASTIGLERPTINGVNQLQTFGTHGRCECNKQVYLFIQLRMN